MENLNQEFWNNRYLENNAPWDIGYAATPLKSYLESLKNKELRILIPGAGFAHEAVFLHQEGFKNVFVCDWAESVLDVFRKQIPDFPKENIICSDFFKLDIEVDLIIEQTFFSAIPRKLRMSYVEKSAQLLQNTKYHQGKLVGLLFAQEFEREGPPFGGDSKTYKKLFSPYFFIEKMELSYNSIPSRSGRELFVNFIKK